jgi:hypothetical protein
MQRFSPDPIDNAGTFTVRREFVGPSDAMCLRIFAVTLERQGGRLAKF